MATKTIQIDREVITAVRSLIDEQTVREASRQLELSEATVTRIAAGIPCTRGTKALVVQRLVTLGRLEKKAA